MKCEACERGDHDQCGMQTWCDCDCDPENYYSYSPDPGDSLDDIPPDPNLSCDQCGSPQWDDGTGLCSWRCCAIKGSCDGKQMRANKE
jgi:hypothetical protein